MSTWRNLTLIATSGVVVPVLDGAFGGAVKKRRRYDFDFSPSKSARQKNWKTNVPPRYELRRIDEQLMQRIRGVANPYSRSYWKSASAFEQHGFGICAIFQGKAPQVCTSAKPTCEGQNSTRGFAIR